MKKTRFAKVTLEEYLKGLAARTCVPGGGSACAFAAGLGAALISMVIRYSLDKKECSKHRVVLKRSLSVSERLRARFLKLTDDDARAYLSKDPKRAISVPSQVCSLSLEGLRLCLQIAGKCNRMLASDVAVAAELLESACAGARQNVAINAAAAGNPKALLKRAAEDSLRAKQIRKLTEAEIGKIIGR